MGINIDWRKLPELMQSERRGAEGRVLYLEPQPNMARYFFDGKCCTGAEGWQQYDTSQDAWYFGVWIHAEALWVLTFAEGDLSLVICKDREEFKRQIASMAEFYGEPPCVCTVIDTDEKTTTKYYAERPTGDAQEGAAS